MKVKTADLTSTALDWAVATCEGVNNETFRLFYEPDEPTDLDTHGFPEFHYSTVWSQGGPIIEREKIGPDFLFNDQWLAVSRITDALVYGPTPLIAAMRCYVASKLGDAVDVPDELI